MKVKKSKRKVKQTAMQRQNNAEILVSLSKYDH